MDREEATKILQEEIDGNLELTLREWQERDEQRLFPALRTAIEALSQPNYETDTEVRLAVTNRKKEKVILWDAYGEVEYYPIEALSTDAVQGVGRYENAMQKLRDMPRYLNGVKEKQITKISTNYTTEKPNDEVEQGNDVVAEPTDLISKASVMETIGYWTATEELGNYFKLVEMIDELPSAEQVTGKLNNPCDSLLKADSESCKEQKSKLDLISRADALEQMAQAECGLHYEDCEADNCACDYIWRILNIPSADRPSGEWVPVSERMPMANEYVIVYRPKMAMPIIVDEYHIYYGEDDDELYEGWDYSECERVIAWMPLPKPYCPNCGAKMGGE